MTTTPARKTWPSRQGRPRGICPLLLAGASGESDFGRRSISIRGAGTRQTESRASLAPHLGLSYDKQRFGQGLCRSLATWLAAFAPLRDSRFLPNTTQTQHNTDTATTPSKTSEALHVASLTWPQHRSTGSLPSQACTCTYQLLGATAEPAISRALSPTSKSRLPSSTWRLALPFHRPSQTPMPIPHMKHSTGSRCMRTALFAPSQWSTVAARFRG